MTIDDKARSAPGLPIEQSPSSDDLMTAVPAVPAAVRTVRKQVRRWLDAMRWPTDHSEDIELAMNEAIANVVDHAYPPDAPGTATLRAWVTTDPHTGQRRIIVAVTDRGRWAAHHPADPPPHVRGHGLVVMSGCMAELHIQRSVAGTTVIMISAMIPPVQTATGS